MYWVKSCGIIHKVVKYLKYTMWWFDRYTFEKMGFEDFKVIVEDVYHNCIQKVKASDLLPFPYKRVAGANMK